MDFSNVETKVLLKTFENLKKGLDAVNKSLENGTFKKAGTKGEAPPSESGGNTLWFIVEVDFELDKRGAKKSDKHLQAARQHLMRGR